MHRIGRDGVLVGYRQNLNVEDEIVVLCYGEIDCRCHIQKQVNLGKTEDDVICMLVEKYMDTICDVLGTNKKVIVTAVVPPVRRTDYERYNGPIQHEFPFVGTDEARARYTQKMNNLLENYCQLYGFVFFQPFAAFKQEDGCMNFECVENHNVHIDDNRIVNEALLDLVDKNFCEFIKKSN